MNDRKLDLYTCIQQSLQFWRVREHPHDAAVVNNDFMRAFEVFEDFPKGLILNLPGKALPERLPGGVCTCILDYLLHHQNSIQLGIMNTLNHMLCYLLYSGSISFRYNISHTELYKVIQL